MDSKEQEQLDLLSELLVVQRLVEENPCGMPKGVMGTLKDVFHTFIGKSCIENASREQVARYLERDVRTLSDWAKKYDDFPKWRKSMTKDHFYDWTEVVRWKLKHSELYK